MPPTHPDSDVVDRIGVMAALEDALTTGGEPGSRLDAAAGVLGVALDATRVVAYGDSDAGDEAVRVRGGWNLRGHRPLASWTTRLPLLTYRPVDEEIVTPCPRGSSCPPDCDVLTPDCPLRGECATILEPLQVGRRRFGRLGVHRLTGREWTVDERLLVHHAAVRLALFLAEVRMERLQRDLDAQREGIAMTVLHQVATPVTVIDGALEHIDRHGVGSSGPLLDAGRVAASQLRRLCDDLVAISGAVPDAGTARDITAELDGFVERARARHASATIELFRPVRLPLVRTVGGAVARTLEALVDNAVRYAGDQVYVSVDAVVRDRSLALRVRDDGPGVPEDAFELLGAAFSRQDPQMRSQPGGSGLGLAIAARVARTTGGDLRLEPRRDAPGTQATLVLPLA